MLKDIPLVNLMETSRYPFRIEKIVFKNHYDPDKLHRHHYHEIFFFEKGGGMHLLDFEHIPIKDRSVHLLLPGQAHQLARAPEANGFVLMFKPDFFHLNSENIDFINSITYLYNGSEYTHTVVNETKFGEFLMLLDNIEREYFSDNGNKAQVLQSYLNIIIFKVKEVLEKSGKTPEYNRQDLSLLYDFKQLLENEFIRNRSVADYCEKLKSSYKQLNKVTHNYTGKNPAEIIADRLLLEAKRLLLHTRMSIKEIAYELSFEDPSHFSKFIKNTSGESPAELREVLGKIYL